MKVGDKVRYVGPTLFPEKPRLTGIVVRMPIAVTRGAARADDRRVMVSGMCAKGRPRPVRPEHLEVVGMSK